MSEQIPTPPPTYKIPALEDPFLLAEFSGISRRQISRPCSFLEQTAHGLLVIVESGTVRIETGEGVAEQVLSKDSVAFLSQNQCKISPVEEAEGPDSHVTEAVSIGSPMPSLETSDSEIPRISCIAVKWLSPRLGHPLVSGKQQTLSLAETPAAHWLATTVQTLLNESESGEFEGSRLADLLTQTLVGLVCRPNTEQFAETISPHERQAWAHPEIGPVLRDIQQQPEFNWTVASMADRVQISRSSFAAKFTDLVGVPPMKYLLQCRMSKAAQLITEGRLRFKQIAGKVGYKTEAAFNTAFKRWSGVSPGEYRRFAASYRPPV